MMKLIYAFFFVVFSSVAAMAQQFVPFVVEQSDLQNLQVIINHNLPPDYSAPIIQWINGLEQQARVKAEAAKKEEKEKWTPKEPESKP